MLLANLAFNVAHLGNMIYLLIHFTKKNKQQETSFRALSGRKNSVPSFSLLSVLIRG